MKSRPMIFSAPMVRALLAGQKTQTRRVVKGVPASHDFAGFVLESTNSKQDGKAFFGIQKSEYHYDQIVYVRCPYGVVGDRLWVRETYAHLITDQCPWRYKATDDTSMYEWKSSMFMPRHASRIELEITGIRVERVQYISEADAIAEGVELSGIGGGMNAHQNYCGLWSKINGNQSWIDNPWVWVVEFKVVK